jgi:hypothetical protein
MRIGSVRFVVAGWSELHRRALAGRAEEASRKSRGPVAGVTTKRGWGRLTEIYEW